MRDLTQAQYVRKMQKLGFSEDGNIMGYWRLPKPFQYTLVSDWNAGANRRDKLAYMTAKLRERKERYAQDTPA